MPPAKKSKPTTTRMPASTKATAPAAAKVKKPAPAKAKFKTPSSTPRKKKPTATAKVEAAPSPKKIASSPARTRRSRPNQKLDPAQTKRHAMPDAEGKGSRDEGRETRADVSSIAEAAKELLRTLGATGMNLVRIIREKGLAILNDQQSKNDEAGGTKDRQK